jgi:hypothetical protein
MDHHRQGRRIEPCSGRHDLGAAGQLEQAEGAGDERKALRMSKPVMSQNAERGFVGALVVRDADVPGTSVARPSS